MKISRGKISWGIFCSLLFKAYRNATLSAVSHRPAAAPGEAIQTHQHFLESYTFNAESFIVFIITYLLSCKLMLPE